jgi:hypothetical protein
VATQDLQVPRLQGFMRGYKRENWYPSTHVSTKAEVFAEIRLSNNQN